MGDILHVSKKKILIPPIQGGCKMCGSPGLPPWPIAFSPVREFRWAKVYSNYSGNFPISLAVFKCQF